MKSILKLSLCGLVTALFAAMLVVAGPSGANRNFGAHLTGDEEVPPAETKGQGQANFILNKDADALSFKLIVTNIDNVRFSHLHRAEAGMNGMVVAFLFAGPTTEGRTSGVISQGTLTDEDLVGPLSGKSILDLVDDIEDGLIYVNVHSDDFPPGELRGQVD